MSIVLVNSYASFPKTQTVASSAVTKNLTVSQNSGFPYTIPIAAAGSTKYGTPPYTWYIVSGTLPAGLTFTGSTGIISGSPTTVTALSTVVFGVRDVNGLVADVTQSINFQVFAIMTATATSTTTQTLTVTEPNYPNFNTFTAASGGVTPYTYYVVSGTLPAGLTLTGSTPVVSGTPTAVQAATNVTFGVRDVNLVSATTTVTVSFTVVAAPTATLNQTAQNLTVGQTGYSFAPLTSVTGGVSPYTYSITSGTLPSTLSQSTTTGTVTGSVTAASSSTVVFKVVDSNGVAAPTASVPYSAVTFSASTDNTAKNFQTGTAISAYAPIIGAGGVTPYNYSISSGTLPTGLSYGSGSGGSGDVTGTPTAVTTSTVSFKVTDANGVDSGLTATETFTITAPVTSSNNYIAGTNITQTTRYQISTWTCPPGVTSISILCIGGGGGYGTATSTTPNSGGGGGAIAWVNNVTVSPGTNYTIWLGWPGFNGNVSYGAGGETAFFNASGTKIVGAGGGGGGYNRPASTTGTSGGGGAGGTVTAGTGFAGGAGGSGFSTSGTSYSNGGGGGAGGYTSAGGAGGKTNAQGGPFNTGVSSSSGGGGGGSGQYVSGGTITGSVGNGGGVSGLGTGVGAAGGTAYTGISGNSGGAGGNDGVSPTGPSPLNTWYGYGAGGTNNLGSNPGYGLMRIVFPGNTRQFPSTNVNTV